MIRSLIKTPNVVVKLQSRVKFPEKFKGTVIEKWANYWKNLFIDYRQMFQDLRTDIQDDPRKAIFWTTGLSTIYALAQYNPDEIDFKHQMRSINNEVILVSEECRKPESIEHLRFLQTCYNEGVIQYRNLGIISFMYISDLNTSCDLYKAQCSYLKPTYSSMLSQIVDVGFMGKWWNVYIKTTNYDVNV